MTLSPVVSRYHHLTLTAACVCLIVALQPIVPRLGPFLWPLAMLTLMADRGSGRYRLPGWLVDLLALSATAVSLGWLYYARDQMLDRPMPIGLVPYVGPLLLVLLVLRLYRSGGSGDIRTLQGMGLLLVALACALTTDTTFGLFLLAYLVLALPLLASLQFEETRRRAGGSAEAIPAPPFRGRAVGWAVAVILMALVLFLLTPRLSLQTWEPLSQLGVPPTPTRPVLTVYGREIDLTRIGTVTLGIEEAFRVIRIDAPDGATPIPVERWRTGVLDTYMNGRWHQSFRSSPLNTIFQEELPDFGPEAVTLRFAANPRPAGGLPLAQPILFGPPEARFSALNIDPTFPLFAEGNATILGIPSSRRDAQFSYTQRTIPGRDRWPLVLPGHLDPPGLERGVQGLIHVLTECQITGLSEWTREQLDALELPADAAPERTAHALTELLASSGQYTYSLEMRRGDPNLDPVLDFLWNVRAGHCERFASALALVLRSQKIPARMVRGFLGGTFDEGSVVVNQQQAHVWVEALVPSADSPLGWDWISLDPTPPATERPLPPYFWSLWERWKTSYEGLWRDLIVGYSAAQQSALWQHWLLQARTGWILLALGGLGFIGLALRWLVHRLRQRWRQSEETAPKASWPLLQRLWELLIRYQLLHYDPSRTPQELAQRASASLAAHPTASDRAGLPQRLVALFYRLRFGGHSSEDEARLAEVEVEALARLLATPS